MHAFNDVFTSLVSMIVNFPGLFPLFLQVNVNLCVFYLMAMQSLFSKQIISRPPTWEEHFIETFIKMQGLFF